MLTVNLTLGGDFHEYEGLSQDMNGISVYEHDTLEVGFERALGLGNLFTVYFGGEAYEEKNLVTFRDLGIENDARLTLIFSSIKEELDSIKEEGCKFQKDKLNRKWDLISYSPLRCLEWFKKIINVIRLDRIAMLNLQCKLL
jgi:hypothetical protein